jgi:nitroreductase
MDIAEAIHQWETIRAFKSDLVPREILKEILDLASCVLLWFGS